MSDEPKKQIEAQLEAWAKHRQEQAGGPIDLHPATRNLLQGEVARQYGHRAGEKEAGASWLAGLWPRMALGASLFTLLVVGAWLVWEPAQRSTESYKLAQAPAQHSAPKRALVEESPATPAPVLATGETAPKDQPVFAPGAGAFDETAVAESDAQRRAYRKLEQPELTLQRREGRAGLASAAQYVPATPPASPPASAAGTLPLTASAPRAGGAPGAAEPTVLLAESRARDIERVEANQRELPFQGGAVPSPAIARATQSEDSFAIKKIEPHGLGELGRTQEAAADPGVPRPATEALARLDDRAKAVRGQNRQRFAQATASFGIALGDDTNTARRLLRLFQLEQAGSELRIVDFDDSVYVGFLQTAAVGGQGGGGRAVAQSREAAAPSASANAVPALNAATASGDKQMIPMQSYFFRVSGTNRTLNQPVVFSGYLIAPSGTTVNQPAQSNAAFVRGAQVLSGVPSLLELPQSQISGKASIGGGNEVEVMAVPLP